MDLQIHLEIMTHSSYQWIGCPHYLGREMTLKAWMGMVHKMGTWGLVYLRFLPHLVVGSQPATRMETSNTHQILALQARTVPFLVW